MEESKENASQRVGNDSGQSGHSMQFSGSFVTLTLRRNVSTESKTLRGQMAFCPQKGHLIIARHFQCWSRSKTEKLVPKGTAEGRFRSSLAGLSRKRSRFPALKRRAIFIRDYKTKTEIGWHWARSPH